MRRRPFLALAGLCLSASAGWADGWEIEAGAGVLGGASVGVRGPFTYRGVFFGREFTNCPLEVRDHPEGPLRGCFAALGFFGSFNAIYTREHKYGLTGVLDLAVRRRFDGPFSVALGGMAGLAPGRQRVNFETTALSLDVRPIPGEVRDALTNPEFTEFRHTDTGALAYLYAALRYEWRLGQRVDILKQPTSNTVFVDAGSGILPAVPGGEESQVGTPLAWHLGAGFRWARSLARDVTVSLVHVHAVSNPPEGIAARYSWTGFRLGLVFER